MTKNKTILNSVIEGDCLKIMADIEPKSIDMILCDLPYGTTQNGWDEVIPFNDYVIVARRKYSFKEYLLYAFANGMEYEKAVEYFNRHKKMGLWSFYETIIKDNGAIVLTSSGIFTEKVIMSRPEWFKYRLVWEKSKSTNFLNVKKQPLRKYEDVCVFYKKQPTYNPQMSSGDGYNKGIRKAQFTGSYGDFLPVEVKSDGGRYPTDVIYFKTAESEGPVYHPTQKPISLGRYLVRTYTNPGETVLDNTSGAGSFLIASMLEGRNFIGIELNKHSKKFKKEDADFVEITKCRLEKYFPSIPTANRKYLEDLNLIHSFYIQGESADESQDETKREKLGNSSY